MFNVDNKVRVKSNKNNKGMRHSLRFCGKKKTTIAFHLILFDFFVLSKEMLTNFSKMFPLLTLSLLVLPLMIKKLIIQIF